MKRLALAVLCLLPLVSACRSPQPQAGAPQDYEGARSRSQESQGSLDAEGRK